MTRLRDRAPTLADGLRLSDAYVRATLAPSQWSRRAAALRAVHGYVASPPADTTPGVARARMVDLIGQVVADNAIRMRRVAGFNPRDYALTIPADDTAARLLAAVLAGRIHEFHRIVEDLATRRGPGALAGLYVAAVDHLAGTLAVEAAR